jgi:hypothetical protein
MTEAVADAQVTGTWTTTDGKQQSAVTKTGNDGRAIFSNVPAGSSFQAKASVDGEDLATAQFAVPAEGGTRLLMLVGAQAAEAMADMTGATPHGRMAQTKGLALRTGKVEVREGLRPGTLEMRVVGKDGKPVANITVDLVHPKHGANTVDVEHAVTDEAGNARFTDLETGDTAKYAATVDREGMRLSTEIFSLDAARGSAGEIRLPGKTNNLSVLRMAATSRMLVELREKAIGILQNLVIENPSDQIFDPGPAGLLIPLPDGFSGTEKLEGGAEVEIKEGVGIFLHAIVPPTQSAADAIQVRLGYLVSAHDTPEFELVQPMPIGLQGGLAMVPGEFPITLSAPGLRARAAERDDNGGELRVYDLDTVAPGAALRLTVKGLPTRNKTGQWIAGVLVGLLVLTGVFARRRPRATPAAEGTAG